MATSTAATNPFASLITRYAEANGLDPRLLASIVQAESGFRADAVSPKGAVGLMQIMPQTAVSPGYGVEPADRPLTNPEENLELATKYLRAQIDRYGGKVRPALVAYNWGPANADRWLQEGADPAKLPEETREYVAKIERSFLAARGVDETKPREVLKPRLGAPQSEVQRVLSTPPTISQMLRERMAAQEGPAERPTGAARLKDEAEWVVKALGSGILDTMDTLITIASAPTPLTARAADRFGQMAEDLRASLPDWIQQELAKKVIYRDENGDLKFDMPSLRQIANVALGSVAPGGAIAMGGRGILRGASAMKKLRPLVEAAPKTATALSYGAANSAYISADTYKSVHKEVFQQARDEGLSMEEAEQEASRAAGMAAALIAPISAITGGVGGLAAQGPSLLGRVGKGVALGAVSEAPEESLQYAIEQIGAGKAVDLAQFLESGVLGALGAGPIEGTMAAISGDETRRVRVPPAARDGIKAMNRAIFDRSERAAISAATQPDLPGVPRATEKDVADFARRQTERPLKQPEPATPDTQAQTPQEARQRELPLTPARRAAEQVMRTSQAASEVRQAGLDPVDTTEAVLQEFEPTFGSDWFARLGEPQITLHLQGAVRQYASAYNNAPPESTPEQRHEFATMAARNYMEGTVREKGEFTADEAPDKVGERVAQLDQPGLAHHRKMRGTREGMSDEGRVQRVYDLEDAIVEDRGDGKFLRVGRMYYSVDPNLKLVKVDLMERLPKGIKGTGVGGQFYENFFRHWLDQGYTIQSDTQVSASAQDIYQAMQRRGFQIEKNPDATEIVNPKKPTRGRKDLSAGLSPPGRGAALDRQPWVYRVTKAPTEDVRQRLLPLRNQPGELPLEQIDTRPPLPPVEPEPESQYQPDNYRQRKLPLRKSDQTKLAQKELAAAREKAQARAEEAAKEAAPGEQMGLPMQEPLPPPDRVRELFEERRNATAYAKRKYGGFRLMDPDRFVYGSRAEANRATKPAGSEIVKLDGRFYVAAPVMEEEPVTAPEPEPEPEAAAEPAPEVRGEKLMERRLDAIQQKIDAGNMSMGDLVQNYLWVREHYGLALEGLYSDNMEQLLGRTGRALTKAWEAQGFAGDLKTAAMNTPLGQTLFGPNAFLGPQSVTPGPGESGAPETPAGRPVTPSPVSPARRQEEGEAPRPDPAPDPIEQADREGTPTVAPQENAHAAETPLAEELREDMADMAGEVAAEAAGGGGDMSGDGPNRGDADRRWRKYNESINEFEKATREFLRGRGVDFTAFKRRLRLALGDSRSIDMDYWNTPWGRQVRALPWFSKKRADGSVQAGVLRRLWRHTVESRIRRALQFNLLPLRQIEDIINNLSRANGQEATNILALFENMHSMVNEQQRKLQHGMVRELEQALLDHKIEAVEMSRYLGALHAPWRNKVVIEEMRRVLDDSGPGSDFQYRMEKLRWAPSGMTDEEAEAIIAEYRDAGRLDDFKAVEHVVRRMHHHMLDVYAEADLVADEALDAWRTRIDHHSGKKPAGMTDSEYALAMFHSTYVPLQTVTGETYSAKMADSMKFATTGNLDVVGDEVKSAMGREGPAHNILPVLMFEIDKAYVRAARAKTLRSLIETMERNPNRFLWETQTVPRGSMPVFGMESGYTARPDPETGLPDYGNIQETPMRFGEAARMRRALGEETVVSSSATKHENRAETVFHFAVKDGDQVRHAEVYYVELGDALSKAEKAPPSNMILRGSRAVTSFMRAVYTTLSPGFMFTNPIRDYGTAKMHLTEEGLEDVAKHVSVATTRRAFRAYRALLKDQPIDTLPEELHPYYKTAQRYRDLGVHTTLFKVEFAETKARNLERRLKDLEQQGVRGKANMTTVRDTLKSAYEYMDELNNAFENAVRLATFHAATTYGGMSELEASKLAKNLTVNFTRRGYMGPAINNLWLFYNASVQGNVRILEFALRSKRGRKYMAGVVAAGFANSLLQQALFDDDDETGENGYLTRPDHERERNIVIANIFSERPDDVFKIPLPYGYNVLWGLGDTMGEMLGRAASGSKPEDGWGHLMSRPLLWAYNAFNPIASSSFWRTLAPTVVEPAVDVYSNRNFFGSPINPTKSPFEDVPVPDAYNVVDPDEKQTAQMIAQGLNKLTGGDPYTSGVIDVAPGTLEYLLEYYSGSAGMSLMRLWDVAKSIAVMEPGTKPGDITAKVPVIRRLYGLSYEFNHRERYYELRGELAKVKEQYEDLRAARVKDPEAAQKFLEFWQTNRVMWDSGVMKSFEYHERAIDRLTAKRNKIRRMPNKTEVQKRMMTQYEDRISQLMQQFNLIYFNRVVRNDLT